MALKNNWVGYLVRSYEQAKASILTRFQSLIPEIRDHSESNIFVKMITIWCGLSEVHHLYIDNAARETFLATVRLFKNAIYLANLVGYRIKGASAVSVEVIFFINAPAPSPILIPGGTSVTTSNNLKFMTIEDVTIPTNGKEVRVVAKQWDYTEEEELGTSTGLPSQKITLGTNVVDAQIHIKVGSVSYLFVDSFAYISKNGENFTTTVDEDGKVVILFGDGVNGKIPPVDGVITASYYTTLGEVGNISENSINFVSSAVTVPSGITLSVKNIERGSGGSPTEGLTQLKKNIPIALKTQDRAVTDYDYNNIAKLVPGVAKAKAQYNKQKVVDIYIAPTGGGVATSDLRNAVFTYLESRSMNTIINNIKSAGEVRIGLEIALKVRPNYGNLATANEVRQNLADFLSVENQEIKGKIELSDLYYIIEDVEGTKSSKILRITPSPYADPQDTAPPLVWVKTLLPGSTTVRKWLIKAINSTTYQLFRDNVFLGNFTVGTQYSQPELTWTINAGSYVVSNQWIFYTYPYLDSFELEEFSVPISFVDDITIYPEGGL